MLILIDSVCKSPPEGVGGGGGVKGKGGGEEGVHLAHGLAT